MKFLWKWQNPGQINFVILISNLLKWSGINQFILLIWGRNSKVWRAVSGCTESRSEFELLKTKKTLELNEIAELRQGRFHPFPVVGDSRENSWFRDLGSAAAERVDAVKVVWPVVPRTEKWSSGITLNKNRHFEQYSSILTAQGALPIAPAHIMQLLIVHPLQLKSLHCSFETRGIDTCFKTSACPVFLVSPQPRVMQSCDMIGIAKGSGIEAMSTVLLKSFQ